MLTFFFVELNLVIFTTSDTLGLNSGKIMQMGLNSKLPPPPFEFSKGYLFANFWDSSLPCNLKIGAYIQSIQFHGHVE